MHNWPYYSEAEIEAAATVLRSGKVNYWTGMEGRLFEKEFTKYYRSEEHTSELQSRLHHVCRLLPEKKNISTT